MHLIFVLLFVEGCTIKGTLSFSYPPPGLTPKPILPTLNSCKNGTTCVDDNHCGGVGFCNYWKANPNPNMGYSTSLLHL